MAGPISGGNLTIKYDCPYLEKYSDSRKLIGFSETLLEET
jgi:hypothetical protein